MKHKAWIAFFISCDKSLRVYGDGMRPILFKTEQKARRDSVEASGTSGKPPAPTRIEWETWSKEGK